MADSAKIPGQSTASPAVTGESAERESDLAQHRPSGPLHTPRGDTTIEESVVQKLAGIATREVPGVYAMGNAARRAFSAVTERIPGSQTNYGNGVSVEKGERQPGDPHQRDPLRGERHRARSPGGQRERH